jgi:quinol monooxygenase YgiN
MMQLSIRLTAQSGHAHDLVEALHARMRQTRREGGCSGAHVAADVVEANSFWYSEDWDDSTSLERELRSDRFSQLLALVETSAQPPIIEFRTITQTRGLEYVAAVREAPEARQK